MTKWSALLLGAATALARTAGAEPTGDEGALFTPPPAAPARTAAPKLKVDIDGYLRPRFGVDHYDGAAARDRWLYGFAGTRVDLRLAATLGPQVSGEIYLIIGDDDLAPVTDATAVDGDGDGTPDQIATITSPTASVEVDTATLTWSPNAFVDASIGRDRLPLTAQSATASSALLFPHRIRLNDQFVLPLDVGASVEVHDRAERVVGTLGAWNGTGADAPLGDMTIDERGLVWGGRLEVMPLGNLPFGELPDESPLRIGLGAAATYRASTSYTPSGSVGAQHRDLRAALSARVAWRQLLVISEVLRRQITDDLTSRPDVASAWYAQASWNTPLGRIRVAPLARVGVLAQRSHSAPTTTTSVELGASVFPLPGNSRRLRITGMYTDETDPDTLQHAERGVVEIRVAF